MITQNVSVNVDRNKQGIITRYWAEIYYENLKEHKLITAKDEEVIQKKINDQFDLWNEKWEKLEKTQKALQEKKASLSEAETRTKEAIIKLQEVDDLLLYTLSVNDVVDWDVLKDNKPFENPQPIKPGIKPYPVEPLPTWEVFKPKFSVLDNLVASRKEEKIRQANALFQQEYSKWLLDRKSIDDELKLELQKYEEELKHWEEQKRIAYEKQYQYNDKIEKLKETYLNKNPEAIVEYCDLVLNNSRYPDSFPKNFELEYNPQNKILIVDYTLPSPEQFPTLNEVKYNATHNELKEYHISETTFAKMFDAAIYKITLRTIHELFEADVIQSIESISFNGWINSINKGTGKRESTCIISIQVKKSDFVDIDLKNVDPKACFKTFKGVGSSKLIGLTPIQPIIQINRTDKRFVNAYSVSDKLDSSINLAAMDWEDFEHLIREVFEKEFAVNGGEVKVTQASKDGGVDAIAFDPDPIRGGKIVIQAKRYTNIVGVSAVRDLYGTVLNEGATKGILVTTADYGSDSYEFAKGKPITLLNGSNLLYLLEKHGTQARINISEAKMMREDHNTLDRRASSLSQ